MNASNVGEEVANIRIAFRGRRDGPFVGEPLAIDVEMGAGDFEAVGISVGRAVEVEAHEHDGLAGAILVGGFGELDLSAGDVEGEVFAFVE